MIKSKTCKNSPKEPTENINNFLTLVIKHIKAKEYELSCIGKMDETPLNINMPSN